VGASLETSQDAMTTCSAEAEAGDALTRALINAAARGQRPRCGDAEVSWMFLDEDPRHRAIAATYCNGCVAWVECDQVGQHQRFGVWASTDRTVMPGRPKKYDAYIGSGYSTLALLEELRQS
jgi:hypothetical protein